MKIGRVSQTVLKRSMIKPLRFRREESLFPVTSEEMCYGIRAEEDEHVILTDITLSGNEKDLGVFALAHVVNHLVSRGASPKGVSVRIMLPPYAYESRLKAMVEHIEHAGSKRGVQVLSAKAEVSGAVTQAIVTMQGVGVVKKKDVKRSAMAKAGQDIVLLGSVGLEGTIRILNEKEEELSNRFVPSFLQQIRDKREAIFTIDALDAAKTFDITAMHQAGNGGILAAMWELCEAADIGMEIYLKQISICQETVEVCEYFRLNPYQLASAGCVLLVTEQGEALAEHLCELGYAASLLGRTTKDKARVILSGEEKRYLDRPAPDELHKIYEM